MKKIILCTITSLLFMLMLFLTSGTLKKVNEKKLLASKIEHLPEFSFVTLSDESFYSSEITEGPLLIVSFHPECEHCHYEISGLLQSPLEELGIKLVLISYAAPDDVRLFLDSCKTTEEQSFLTLIDTAMIFGDIFGRNHIPSNYLYNKELDLIEALYGEYTAEAILSRFDPDGQRR